MLPVDRLRVLLEHHICSQPAAADGLGDGGRALRIGTPWSWPSHVQRGVSEHLHVEQMLMANGGLIVSILFAIGSEIPRNMAFKAFALLDCDLILSGGFAREAWAKHHADLLLAMVHVATAFADMSSAPAQYQLNRNLVRHALWILRREATGSSSSSDDVVECMRDMMFSLDVHSELYPSITDTASGPGDHGETLSARSHLGGNGEDNVGCEDDEHSGHDGSPDEDEQDPFSSGLAEGHGSPVVIEDMGHPDDAPEDTAPHVVSDRVLQEAAQYHLWADHLAGDRNRPSYEDHQPHDAEELELLPDAAPSPSLVVTPADAPIESPAKAPVKAPAPAPASSPAEAPAAVPIEVLDATPADGPAKTERKVDLLAERHKWIKSFKADPMNVIEGESLSGLHKRAQQAWTSSSDRLGFLQVYDEKERKRRRF